MIDPNFVCIQQLAGSSWEDQGSAALLLAALYIDWKTHVCVLLTKWLNRKVYCILLARDSDTGQTERTATGMADEICFLNHQQRQSNQARWAVSQNSYTTQTRLNYINDNKMMSGPLIQWRQKNEVTGWARWADGQFLRICTQHKQDWTT